MSSPAGHAPRNIVLAYSGRFDPSCNSPWLQERSGGIEVIAAVIDVGQPDDLSRIEAKALASGVTNAYVIDAGKMAAQRHRRSKKEFLEDAR